MELEPAENLASPAAEPRVLPKALLLAAALTLITLLLTRGTWLTDAPDSLIYEDMAHGRSVAQPFANRILHPAIVRGLATTLHISTDTAFLITDIAALFTFLAAACFVLLSFTRHALVVVAFLFSPFLLQLFRNGYLPDLPHAALLAVFFALLMRRRSAAALAVLFLLVLARESTLLLSLVLLFALHKRAERRLRFVAVVTIAALLVVQIARSSGPGNAHAASTPLYLLLKMPFNISKNLLGIVLWTNTLENLKHFPPVATIKLPRYLRVGAIHSVGYAGFHAQFPLMTLATILTEFGVAPAVLWVEWRRRGRTLLAGSPLWTSVALIYGAASYFLGPALGAEVWRLVGYAWPAMLLATPVLLIRSGRLTPALLIAHTAAALAGFFVAGREPTAWKLALIILAAGVIQACAIAALRRPAVSLA